VIGAAERLRLTGDRARNSGWSLTKTRDTLLTLECELWRMRENDREFCARALACLKRAFPVDGPGEAEIVLSPQDSPVLTNLNSGLLVAYLVDRVEHFKYVQQKHLTGAGLTQAELHQQGIANLRALLKQKDIKVQPYGNVFAVLCGGNFEASAVLVDGLWNNALAHLAPNGFVAAIPCRDILAFCDAENALGLQELRQIIERTRHGEHPISSVLYRRNARTWEPYAD
jgi:uncharacterized protein DUF1444